MNYLAHAYLSFNNSEILVGNMISDFVKGKKKWDYPAKIQQGIMLHRDIDNFTDTHPITREAKSFFRVAYGLYSGAIMDIIYDHFLATDPKVFNPDDSGQAAPMTHMISKITLAAFAASTYRQLSGFAPLFPEKFARMFPYMQSQNWLYNYRYKEGIYNALGGLSRRANYMPDPQNAREIFETHYEELKALYNNFFPLLEDFTHSKFLELN